MLKVKDNVNLKELEKYGFKYFENGDYKVYEKDEWNSYLGVEIKNRLLQIGCRDYTDIEENIIYDMIKDNILEKVDDNK